MMTKDVRLFMLLTPKNWQVFQHYKDRCPPWIKLHRDLLINREYMSLPLASKALAPLLWLLASEAKDGVFVGSTDELVFRLHMSPKEIEEGLKPLISKGFFTVASTMLADCKQVAIPETETETETEREAETEKRQNATVVACPSTVEQNVWKDWLVIRKAKKLPITDTAWKQIQVQFRKANLTDQQGVEYCCLSNWASFKATWYTNAQGSNLSKSGQTNQTVMSGLTRGLIGGQNVTLLGN